FPGFTSRYSFLMYMINRSGKRGEPCGILTLTWSILRGLTGYTRDTALEEIKFIGSHEMLLGMLKRFAIACMQLPARPYAIAHSYAIARSYAITHLYAFAR